MSLRLTVRTVVANMCYPIVARVRPAREEVRSSAVVRVSCGVPFCPRRPPTRWTCNPLCVAACRGHRVSSSISRVFAGGGGFSRCGYRRAAGGVRPRAIRLPWREIPAALSNPAGCPLPASVHRPNTKAYSPTRAESGKARFHHNHSLEISDWLPGPFSIDPADCTYANFVALERY